jgi:putative endonuclease
VKKKPQPGSRRPSSSLNTRAIGTRAERRALRHYRVRGYRVLATNLWVGGYELDLVLQRGRLIVFCEVKAKRGSELGDPLEMVTPEKVRRLRQAAEAWLAANPDALGCEVRFDVAVERTGKLEVLNGAF